MTEEKESWSSITGLAQQVKSCDEAGFITPSIAMSYICIDTMASLSRPLEKSRVSRSDFVEWCDKYLKAHPEQTYQYRGKDVYAARCSFFHTYGSKSELHAKNRDIPKFVYHDGGRHSFNPEVDPKLVLIATRSFTNDVYNAVCDFLDDCAFDVSLKSRVASRLSEVLAIFPVNKNS